MDLFKDHQTGLTSPASDAIAVTPDDNAALTFIPRAIYVGGTGDVSLEMQGGQIVTFTNVQGGTVLAVRALRVRQTGTTATGIVALW